jgi:spore maturation protein SpmB
VLPLGVIAIRASLGSENAAGIFVPSILATMCSTLVAVLVARSLAGRAAFAPERYEEADDDGPAETLADGIVGLEQAEEMAATRTPMSPVRALGLLAFGLLIALALVGHLREASADTGTAEALREVLNSWLLPLLMATIVLFGFSHRVKVYESFIKGAREGFDIAVMIIPYLVAILVAVGMFRASGALDALVAAASPLTSLVGFPAEALPMALIRPLSGSGAMGIMTATMTEYGADSFVGYLVSVMNGSTETTFYVIALYFGSVRVRAVRHTLVACLAADAMGVAAALLWSRLFY